jgi:uncharacterized membrane protein HdeD (DUF308 family)
MRIHLAILRSAACLVPGEQRAEWLAEWSAELWHVRHRGGRRTTGFCLGSFRDALWLRRNRPPNDQPWLRLESPVQCLGFLGLVAAVCALFGLRFHPPTSSLPPIGQSFLLMLWIAAMSLPALLATTSLRLGEYPVNRYGWRWVFFAGKIALVLPLVFFGALALWPIVGPMFVHCMLAGYAIAFRWALIDQRRRCPECLRLLAYPAPVGRPSHTFLDWYGTEFACPKGHGLLHVPEIPTVSFRTQRWLHLDRSWSGLFS